MKIILIQFFHYKDADFRGNSQIIPSFQIIKKKAIVGGYLAGKLEPMAENRVKMSFFHYHLFL